jgi:DNA-binding beta-propeller fold protein YncE
MGRNLKNPGERQMNPLRQAQSLAGLVLTVAILFPNLSQGRGERIVLVAGGEGAEGGPAVKARLQAPFGVDFDPSGNMFIVELTGGRVLKVGPQGILTRFGGTGKKGDGGDGGPVLKAEFNGMHSLAIAPGGDIYLADTWNNRVRKVDARTGTITAFAGTGEKGYGGDGGPAARARFGGIYCVALDPKGEKLYLADLDNRRIRRVDLATGAVSTVAGNGEKGVPKDGAEAVQAPLVDPRAVAVDGKGNVYILERGGHALRVVDAQGKVRTVAGTGQKGSGGDGGEALKAQLNGPKHLCIDRDGNVLIADTENHLIRKYLPAEGKIVRVAGSGIKGTAGVGGPPERVELNQPHGVYVHPTGVLYITDSTNNRVLKIEPMK